MFFSIFPFSVGFGFEDLSNLSLNQAICLTIKFNPNIHLQQAQTFVTGGVFQTQVGRFDANLSVNGEYRHDSVPRILSQRLFNLSRDITDRNEYGVSLNKESYEGAVFGAQVVATRFQSNLQHLLLIDPEYRGEVAFTMQVPLLRGTVAYADEIAARLEYEATVDELQQVVSQNVLNTILAYYALLGARDRFNTLHAAKLSAQKFLRSVRILIKADERPRSDIHLALAFLEERSNLEIGAQQALLRAKQDLGLSMGIPAEDIYLLKVPSAKLPPVNPAMVHQYTQVEHLMIEAKNQRTDIKAGEKRIQAEDVLLKQAHNNLEPQLNLDSSIGYRGLHEGSPPFSGLSSMVSGPVALARLTYSYPIGNHQAQGRFETIFAERSRTVITLGELIRTINLNINLFTNLLINSAQQIAQTDAASINYRIAEANEIKKLAVGQSTVIDAIRVSDQRLNTDLDNIDNKVTYSTGIPRLKFESGELICRKDLHYFVNLRDIPNAR